MPFYWCRILYIRRKDILMGTITGLTTVATALVVIIGLGTVAVLGLTFAFVVPAVRVTRPDRIRRRTSIPAYYLHPSTAH